VRPVPRVPNTAKCTTLDFNLDGDVGDLLATGKQVQDMRFKLTLGDSGSMDIVTEELATI
jgi:hypothetical protein